MALSEGGPTLLQIQTELQLIRAADADLELKVRQGQLVEHARVEKSTIDRAHRVRDQLMTGSTRHAALLAGEFDLDPAALALAFENFIRAGLIDTHDRPRPEF